jgi:hypothetical protein
MKPIERLKPEVLANLETMSKVYPYAYKEIMDQLNTREGWTRLDYVVAMDIERHGKVAWLGDAFYDTTELEENKKLTKKTI